MDAKEAVETFIDAANRLRGCEEMEVNMAFEEAFRTTPIRAYYSLHLPSRIYMEYVKARLPEGD